MKMFRAAGSAEILRSHQKDDYHISKLRALVADVFQNLSGVRRWMKWRKELDLLADFGYFALTTLSGFQTIGEEYVNVIQTDYSLRKLPSKWKSVLMVILQVISPYVLRKSLESLEKTLKSSTSPNISPKLRERLLNAIPTLRYVITILHRCNLAAFYLEGSFYHIAKRLMGVHYVKYMAKSNRSGIDTTFRLLGWMSLLQLSASLCIQLYSIFARQSSTALPEADDETGDLPQNSAPSRKCSLCLETRMSTTVTPCGHLFCWTCIHEWCQTKSECPLCRDDCPSHRLVFLQNFDT